MTRDDFTLKCYQSKHIQGTKQMCLHVGIFLTICTSFAQYWFPHRCSVLSWLMVSIGFYKYLLPKTNIDRASQECRVTRVKGGISLRLLALILCSNCSNTFNKVLTATGRHTVKLLFANKEHPFCLQNMPPRMVEAFH